MACVYMYILRSGNYILFVRACHLVQAPSFSHGRSTQSSCPKVFPTTSPPAPPGCPFRCSVLLYCVLQSVAVCCSLLQSVAVWLRVRRCCLGVPYKVFCSRLCKPCVCCSMLQHVTVCCSMLQYVAVCCSVLWCVAMAVYCSVTISLPTPPKRPLRYCLLCKKCVLCKECVLCKKCASLQSHGLCIIFWGQNTWGISRSLS